MVEMAMVGSRGSRGNQKSLAYLNKDVAVAHQCCGNTSETISGMNQYKPVDICYMCDV